MRRGCTTGGGALLETERLDPKFWNARFNLARDSVFEERLGGSAERFQICSRPTRELQGEGDSADPVQDLLTYLSGERHHGRFHLAKFELSLIPRQSRRAS